MSEQTFTLNVTAQRVEYLLNVLAQRPYIEVAAILDELRAQLQAQAQTPDAPRFKAV